MGGNDGAIGVIEDEACGTCALIEGANVGWRCGEEVDCLTVWIDRRMAKMG